MSPFGEYIKSKKKKKAPLLSKNEESTFDLHLIGKLYFYNTIISSLEEYYFQINNFVHKNATKLRGTNNVNVC